MLLDSAVVAGFLDRDDAWHAAADARLRVLAGRERLVTSVITYAQLLTAAGLGHHDEATVRGFFAALVDDVHDVDRRVAQRAATLRVGNPALKLPDALILATADVHAVDVVLTADHRWAAAGIGPHVELLAR